MDKFEPIVDSNEDDFDWIFDINVKGPYRLIKKAIPMMKDGGNIVIVSSIASIRGGKAGVSYTASKHALNGIGKNTAAMYEDEGIRCNIVAPGGIQTEIITDMDSLNEKGFKKVSQGASVSQMSATAEQIADNVLYLASDLSSNINGAVIVSDGGLTVL